MNVTVPPCFTAYLIYERVDPTTEVGTDVHLKKLERCKMGDHDNAVAVMLCFMEEHCQILRHNRKGPSNYRRLLLDALLTGPNATFNTFIQRMVNDVESGTGRGHSPIEKPVLFLF